MNNPQFLVKFRSPRMQGAYTWPPVKRTQCACSPPMLEPQRLAVGRGIKAAGIKVDDLVAIAKSYFGDSFDEADEARFRATYQTLTE